MTIRILYVEDSDLIRDMVAELIETDDRHVDACESAEDAHVLLAQHPYDLVITDVNLPGQSGIDLTKHLVQSLPQVPVILCTGHNLAEHVHLLGGRVHHLLKPFEPEDLQAAIERVLNPSPLL